MRIIMRCWCWIKFRYLKEEGEMQRRCSGSFLPGACSRCFRSLKKIGQLSIYISWEKRMTPGKVQNSRKKLQQCMLKIATSMFPICLKHPRETGRDGIPAACVLGNIQKVKHLPTLHYFKFSQTWLRTRAVVTISKQALQVFCSGNILWFPWPGSITLASFHHDPVLSNTRDAHLTLICHPDRWGVNVLYYLSSSQS